MKNSTKMKKIKKLIYITASFASMLIVGCSEDFLDIKPAGKVGETAFFADTLNIDLMVSGVYGTYLYKITWMYLIITGRGWEV
jgi:hypothetical protein